MKLVKAEAEAEAEAGSYGVIHSALSHPLGLDKIQAGLTHKQRRVI